MFWIHLEPLIQALLANQNFQCGCVGRKLMNSGGGLGARSVDLPKGAEQGA